MRIMKKLLIATNNQGKVAEFRALLNSLPIQLVTPAEINLDLDVPEDGETYAENASIKALAFAQASGLLSLADDSGLEVEALNWAPGLYSARYGASLSTTSNPPGINENGVKLTDASRRAYLLANLRDKPRPWRARFRATIAIARPNLDVHLADGECLGEIIPEERGEGGFGYDPIFLIPELNRTMAELDMDDKNRLSHRARAVMNARPTLLKILESGDS
jgi:XTP/dITP diphosphohydrolase